MTEEFLLRYVLPLIFLLTGFGLLISADRHRRRTLAFLAKARETTGKVIALEEIPSQQPGASEYETYAPVVMFATDDGRTVRFTSLASAYPAKYIVGDAVRVLYKADCPEQARIRSFHALWFMLSLLGALGLLFFGVGAGLLIFGV